MKETVIIMKRYFLALMLLLLCIIGTDSRKVKAYSVTVEKDGIYAEVVPDSFINNTGTIFKKYVDKAMKYYNKYKDADDYTYVSKVPEEYRDFIPIAKQIQDADEIVIRNPFVFYVPGESDEYGDLVNDYFSFYAVKNGKKLCVFDIHMEYTGKLSFEYDKIEDGRFAYDEKTTGETLFYWIGDILYAETPDSTSIVWDQRSGEGGMREMITASGTGTTDWKAVQERADEKFRKKSYSEKKEEILASLAKSKNAKSYKKAEKNLKLELKDEYVEPEKDAKENGRTGIYIVIGIGVLLIGVVGGSILWKKRKDHFTEKSAAGGSLLKYVFKNIRSFAKDYTKIFVLLIITIAASTLIIHLSYGMFREYKDRRELSSTGTKEIVLRLDGSYGPKAASGSDGNMILLGDLANHTYMKRNEKQEQDVTVADMKQFARKLDRETSDKLLNIHTGILQGDYRFETDFLISDGKMVNSGDYGFDSLYNFSLGFSTTNIFQHGRYFTDQEYAKGEKVCIMHGFQKNPGGDYMEENLLEDGKVLIGGQEYQIIGLQNGVGTGYLPITSVDGDSILLDEITLRFQDNISLREIGLINDAAKQCFGKRAESNYELEENEENSYLYNTILLLVLVVSLVAAFNFCALYHYIVTTRRRMLKIFRICGLSHQKSIWLYLGECSMISAGTYLVTLLLFHFLLMPFLAGKMKIFDFHYQAGVYLALFLIYFISAFLLQYVMIAWNLKKKMIR